MRIAGLLRSASERIGHGRSAVVVASEVDFGMGRMFQALMEGSRTRVKVFRSIDEARAWLAGPRDRD